MATTASAAPLSLGAIRPEDAIAAFQARKLLRPSFRWQEVWQAEHARAFAVAGVMRMDVLKLIRDEVDAAVTNGLAFKQFRNSVREQLVAKGFWGDVEITDPTTGEVRTTKFDNRRLSLIFDVNMRQSHAAGAWARAQRSRMPYLVYRTMRDERVRASHKPWDNLVLPKDHPWWDTHYPPNGWRCRCTAFAIDEAGLKQLRAQAPADAPVKTTPPETQWVEFVNRATGQTERVPRGIDPGFAYNPGQEHVARGVDMLSREINAVRPIALKGAPAEVAQAAGALPVQRAVIARMRSEKAFKQFLATPPATPNVGMPVAALPGMAGEPAVASVRATDLLRQVGEAGFPRGLPTLPSSWALAQVIIDRGQRLDLADGRVLWWWARGSGAQERVHVLELTRSALVWWVQQLATLSVDEAATKYPPLQRLLAGGAR